MFCMTLFHLDRYVNFAMQLVCCGWVSVDIFSLSITSYNTAFQMIYPLVIRLTHSSTIKLQLGRAILVPSKPLCHLDRCAILTCNLVDMWMGLSWKFQFVNHLLHYSIPSDPSISDQIDTSFSDRITTQRRCGWVSVTVSFCQSTLAIQNSEWHLHILSLHHKYRR